MDIELAAALEENARLRRDLEELTITNDYQRVISDKNERISFLESDNKALVESRRLLAGTITELQQQLSDVHDCFISASSGDDFEMAEAAREVMEVLDIRCYRHGEVKSKLTEAKEIIEKMLPLMPSGYNDMGNTDGIYEVKEEAEQFLKGE